MSFKEPTITRVYMAGKEIEVYTLTQVEQYFLSIQRVKEALETHLSCSDDHDCCECILEELGL